MAVIAFYDRWVGAAKDPDTGARIGHTGKQVRSTFASLDEALAQIEHDRSRGAETDIVRIEDEDGNLVWPG